MAMHLVKLSILVVTFDLVVFLRYAASSNWVASPSLKSWYIMLGSAHDFDCRLPNPSAQVYLLRKSTTLNVDGIKVSQAGQRFTVYNFNSKDVGKYKCMTWNADGHRQLLEKGKFHIYSSTGTPTVNGSPKVITEIEKGSATFTCQSSSSKPIKSVTWFKEKEPVQARWQNRSVNGKVHTNILTLPDLHVKESGSYECRTQLKFQYSLMTGYWFTDVKLVVTEFKFLTTKRQSFLVRDVGSSINITCETTDPSAVVSLWKEEINGNLKTVAPDGTRIIKKGGLYSIHSISLRDGRKYLCKATSKHGQTISMEMGTLVVLQGGLKNPKAFMTPTTKIFQLGESFNITCHAFGDAISFSWFKDGSPVPTNMLVVVPTRLYKGYSRFESLLVIKKAQKAIEGIYECHITSGRQPGYSNNATANLTVYGCPKPNGKFADSLDRAAYLECKNGVATRLRCRSRQYWEDKIKKCIYPATTPPPPTVRWLNTNYKRQWVPLHINFIVDCNLSNPLVKVSLIKSGKKVNVDGKKVKQSGQMFNITRLDFKDGGRYSCQADGIPDQMRVSLYVDPEKSLTLIITKSPSHGLVELETTHSYTMRCSSLYHGELHWYRQDSRTHTLTPITKGTTQRNYRIQGHYFTEWNLTLSKVTHKDAGIYMCRKNVSTSTGINQLIVAANATFEVIVRAPIKPDIVTDTRKEVTEGQSIIFKSKITGSPVPTIDLSKGGAILFTCFGGQKPNCTKKGRYRGSWSNDKKSLAITVSRISYPADKEFILTARNVGGEKQVKVKVKINVPPDIFKKDHLHFVLSSFKHQIKCLDTASRPDPTFTWEYQPWPCDSRKHTCDPLKNAWKPINSNSNTGIIITSKSRLSILEVPPSDNFVFYRCIAENIVGKDSTVFSLLRTDKRTETLKIEQGETLSANEHQNISLTCTGKFQYNSPPYWMYGNNIISNTSRIRISEKISPLKNTSLLKIYNAQINDSGIYICVAPSEQNISNDQIKLNVLAVTPPSIEFESQIVNATDTVTLNCTVRGHPRPTITWYKGKEPLEVRYDLQSTSECSYRKRNVYYHLDTKPSGAGNPNTYTLVICDARQQNSGWYQCSALNTVDEAKKKAYLDVLAPPSIKLVGHDRHDWQIGDQIIVKCAAKGNPTPKVRWLKQRNDELFVPFGNVSMWSLEHKFLNIPKLKKDDFTTYRCEAKNKLGEDKKAFPITIKAVVRGLESRQSGAISKPALIAIVVSGGLVILLLLIIIAVLYRRKKLYGGFYILTLPPMPDYIKKLDPSRPIQEQTNKLPLCPDWEFPRNRLTLGKIIGSGAFGQVFKSEAVGIVAFDPRGSIKGKGARRRSRFGSTRSHYYGNKQVTTVACKGLKEDATESEYRDLVSELKILMHIGEHKNIVNLLGACTKGRECDLLVIIEFCPHGNLLEFLRKRRDLFDAKWAPATEKPDETFTTTDLVITAFQVARAMEFLASRRCVHRDLAARNVLVGDNYVMKVADFGLARDIYKNEHYVKTTSGLLPVKWMAIEALVDRIYTHQSDVWSFGVLLWEIFTLGGSPYPGLPANEVYQYLMEGQRMHEPDDCPPEIYALMLNCWEHDANQRNTFAAIVKTIDKLLEDQTTQTGEEYLELENEIDPFENQPYYLQPEEIHSFQPPESPSPFDNLNSPLPPLPQDEIEMQQLIRRNSEDPNSNKKDFVLMSVPKHKIKKNGSYNELNNHKRSDSSGIVSDDEDYESEQEHLMNDFDGDRVFDSPPPYINTKPYSTDFSSDYANEVPHKTSKDGVSRGRQQSARYV